MSEPSYAGIFHHRGSEYPDVIIAGQFPITSYAQDEVRKNLKDPVPINGSIKDLTERLISDPKLKPYIAPLYQGRPYVGSYKAGEIHISINPQGIALATQIIEQYAHKI